MRPEGCQIFPTNIVSRKISKCQNISKCCISSSWNSYLRCIKGTACLANIAKHSLKTSPIKPHYETLDYMNQQFEQAVHQEGGWGIPPSWSLKSWGFLICQKPLFWSVGSLKTSPAPLNQPPFDCQHALFRQRNINFLSTNSVTSVYSTRALPEYESVNSFWSTGGSASLLVHIDWQWMPRTKKYNSHHSYVCFFPLLLLLIIRICSWRWLECRRWEGGDAYIPLLVAFCCPPCCPYLENHQ